MKADRRITQNDLCNENYTSESVRTINKKNAEMKTYNEINLFKMKANSCYTFYLSK
jgi:hypothetical protein